MRRLVYGTTAGLLLAAGTWLAVAAPPADKPPPETLPNASHVDPASAAPRYVGAGSCAAVACHGGTEPAKQPWQSSYTVWASHDDHARAFSVLYDDGSKKMLALLDGLSDWKQARPFADQRCLACHTITGRPASEGKTLLADGVSCEACHGPAEHWLAAHVTADWKKLSVREKYGASPRQMAPTNDVLGRARQCVDCHVGAPANAERGEPGRTVNHDLIAAGHPPLRFEFSSFMAKMPRHWDARADRQRIDHFAARSWAVGQAVAAQSQLSLLAAQASEAAKAPGDDAPARPWPEFAHYECYACHQALTPKSFQTELSRRGSLGQYLPSRWYWIGPQAIVESGRLGQTDLAPLAQLRSASANARPAAAAVQPAAAEAARAMGQLAEQLNRAKFSPPALSDVLDILLAATGGGADPQQQSGPTWEEAVQLHLLATALAETQRDVRPSIDRRPAQRDREIRQRLIDLNKQLAFDEPVDRNRSAPRFRYGTPSHFTPAKFRADLDALLPLLTQGTKGLE